ncbi:MAG: CBS domain-containing protein [Bacillota bacterium]
MTEYPVHIGPRDTLSTALQAIFRGRFEGLPVVEAGQVVGLITEKGILRAYTATEALQNKRAGKPVSDLPFEAYALGDPVDPVFISDFLREHTVDEVMNRTTITVRWDEPLERAAYLMKEHGYSILPVTNDEQALVGVISKSDLFDALVGIFGYDKPGYRLVLAVDNRPGQVAGVTAVAKRLGINISAVALHDVNLMHTMTLVMKVEAEDPKQLVEELRQAHYVVREVQKI